MTDFTTATIDYQSGSGNDTTPVWTGTTMQFGGTSGANEMRWQRTGGAGGASTTSANWPFITRPASNSPVEQCWVFTADGTGLQVTTYTGTNANSRMFRFNFDANGSPASVMQLSAYQDVANTPPTPGSQTPQATDGRNIVNGSTDTGNASYLKGEIFGSGFPVAGAQETPTAGSLTTPVAITDGTAGAISPAAGAWVLTHWQSLQGATQYLQAPSIAKSLQAFFWYFCLCMFIGPTMQTGTFVFVPANLTYTWT